jgi:adenine deaminase
MSDQPVESVRAQLDALLEAVRVLGSPLHDPFMQLGFLALEVIPRLKLTDLGLVDVDKFDFVPLWVE